MEKFEIKAAQEKFQTTRRSEAFEYRISGPFCFDGPQARFSGGGALRITEDTLSSAVDTMQSHLAALSWFQ